MKNKEKFAKEIIEIAVAGSSIAMRDGVLQECHGLPCSQCDFCSDRECDEKVKEWAESEYVEPKYEIDWASVPVDTPVLIKGAVDDRRYFSRLLPDGRLAVFPEGRTSWSSYNIPTDSKADIVLAREEDKLKYRKRVER